MARWPLVLYTDNLPDGVAGDAHGPVIRLREGREADEGLYRHELQHVVQWAIIGALLGTMNGVIAWLLAPIGVLSPMQAAFALGFFGLVASHPMLYMWVTAYREVAEVGAYRMQMRYPDGKGGQLTLDNAAFKLADDKYRLGITIDQARELLRD